MMDAVVVTRKKREPLQPGPQGAKRKGGDRGSERVCSWKELLTGAAICSREAQSILSDLEEGWAVSGMHTLAPIFSGPQRCSPGKPNRKLEGTVHQLTPSTLANSQGTE